MEMWVKNYNIRSCAMGMWGPMDNTMVQWEG
jgi:hypothetical protein